MLHLKEIRTAKGVSQQTVADYLEITRQAYSNYENGNREPDMETLLKLGEYFDVTVDEILRGPSAVGMDDFTYAMHGHSGNLTEDDKDILLRMAQQLADAHGKKDADGGTN